MAQPSIDGTGQGNPRMVFGSDGTDWYALLVDTLGRLISKITGFDPVPSSPVNDTEGSVTVSTGTSTTLADYTVTTGKTLYITDIWAADRTLAAGIEFVIWVTVAGTVVWKGRVPAGSSGHFSLNTPIKATTAQQILLRVYQWSGGDKAMEGGVIGFEV